MIIEKYIRNLIILLVITAVLVVSTTVYTAYSIFYVPADSSITYYASSVTSRLELDNTIPLEEKYAEVFNWQKKHYVGDFNIEQLNFLKEQCDVYDIPIEIMMSIICTESSFMSYSKAKTSTAAGYCSVILGTAKWVYEDLLKYGEYNYNADEHQYLMTTNWKLNIEIGCRFLYCNYWNSNQSWDRAIQKYYGSTNHSENVEYLNRVNKNMRELFDITTINIS